MTYVNVFQNRQCEPSPDTCVRRDNKASYSLRLAALTGTSTLVLLAGAAAAAAPEIETIIVQGQRYDVQLSTLTKLTEPIIDVPQSINTVSSQVIQDRMATSLNDALRNVPSITLGAGEFSWQGNNPTIRGFSARSDIYIDGMRDFGSYYRDPFYLQELEVLEGPASMIFGRGSTGGVINQVSKVATLNPRMSGELTLGTDATKRLVVDVDQPLTEINPNAAIRLVAMGHENDVAGRNDAQYQRYGFAPSLALGLGTATHLTLTYLHQSENDVPDYGLPWFNGAPAAVDRNNFYGFKSDYLKTDVDIVTARIEHEFSDSLTLHSQTRYANYDRDIHVTEPLIAATYAPSTPLANIMVTRNIFTGPSRETMAWNQTDVTAKFATGIVHHDLVAGVEGGRESSAPNFGTCAGVPSVSLVSPDPNALFSATSCYNKLYADTVAWSFGMYGVDTIKIGEHWEAVAGLRWDRFSADYHSITYSLPPATTGVVTGTSAINQVSEQPSYRGGLVYKPVPNGSIYFGYGTSFDPSAEAISFITSGRGLGTQNKFLSPEKNRSYEAGTKWSVFDQNLTVTGAIFRTIQYNARVPDPANSGLDILAGNFRASGAETSVSGHLTSRWQVTASYTYLHTDVIASDPGAAPVGSRLTLAPNNAASIWTTYAITNTFEVGAGSDIVGNRLAQNTAPVEVAPGYATFDAMAKYQMTPHISLQANVTNIGNKYYYDQLHPYHVVPGAARTALFAIDVRY